MSRPRPWWRRLARYARPHLGGLGVTALLMLATVGLNALKPWPLKVLVDSVIGGSPLPGSFDWMTNLPFADSQTGLVAWLAASSVVLVLLVMLAGLVQQYLVSGIGARMSYRLAEDAFDRAQRAPGRLLRERQTGDLIQRILYDTSAAHDLASGVFLPVVTSLVTLVIMFAVMVRLDAVLTLVALGVVFPLALAIKVLSRPMSERAHLQQELEGEMMSLAEQTLTSLPVVQAFRREEHQDLEFRSVSERTARAFLGLTVAQLQFSVATGGVTAMGTALVIALGGLHVLDGRLTVGGLLVFLSYLASLYAPLETLASVASTSAIARASAGRVLEVLDLVPDSAESPHPVPLTGRVSGHVCFDDVTYGYATDRPVVRNVTLDIRPGERVAIVGSTGGGKSTLVGLMARFADPWSGRVTVDDVDVRDLALADLRRQIAFVLQEPFLLPVSIAENIAYGRPDATREQIVAAAIAAQADGFIGDLPEGYDTVVGDRGATLSGGERQRIAIARALLKDAPILVLDEPTSALDSATEADLLDALERLMAGRTSFVIAHRLTTVRNADRIVVMDDGHVVEQGTREQLLAARGAFRRLHDVQRGDPDRPSTSASASGRGEKRSERPLTVALVSQEYPPETGHGGIAAQTYAKAHGLAARGHQVFVISRSIDNDRHERQDGDVHVTRVPGLDERLPLYTDVAGWVTYSAQVAAEVAARHAATPLDVVDFPEYGCEGYVHLLNQTEWNHIPTAIQLHGPLIMLANALGWPDRDSELYREGTAMERATLRLADGVYSSSEQSARWCAARYGLDLSRAPILHTGVDLDLFRPGPTPPSERRPIMFVGRIARAKGAEVLARAAIQLADERPGLRLRMVGRDEGHLAETLLVAAAAAGHPDLIELPGPMTHAELAEELPNATIFASPSFYEGGPGMVLLEAMACGRPVVACDGSGVTEVVTNEDNGLLVPPDDVEALTKALDRLLRYPDEREAMGARGRARVEMDADQTVCIDRLEDLYRTLIDDGSWWR